MSRSLAAFAAIALVACRGSEPAPTPATRAEQASRPSLPPSDEPCTEQKWTPELVRALTLDAFDERGFGPTRLAGVRATLPLLPTSWPSSACVIVVYLYYVEEPRIIPNWDSSPQRTGMSSPLLASAKLDLKSSLIEVELVDYSTASLGPGWIYRYFRYRVSDNYELVREAEQELIGAVVAHDGVLDPQNFDAYSRAWQHYPHYLELLPSVHRSFIDEMLFVRPVLHPKHPGVWNPVVYPDPQ